MTSDNSAHGTKRGCRRTGVPAARSGRGRTQPPARGGAAAAAAAAAVLFVVCVQTVATAVFGTCLVVLALLSCPHALVLK